ncbi:MAG: hypothetical protein O2956_02275 [Gemmatimonadetes bacterium]|nr:hypothetical protein [Gemmatimonadota bacterium]
MQPSTLRRLSRAHRTLGVVVTVPIVLWILSSFVLHGVGLALPNGLQGVYELVPYHPASVRLEEEGIASADALLQRAAADGLTRVYWLRLETLGDRPSYVVKPGPFELERVYDARSLERLDPLSDELLTSIIDEHLIDTRVEHFEDDDEFNRYYALERVPAVGVEMAGAQPSELIFSRSSGRILRRTDPLASWFDRAYKSVHVWQWGDSLRLFTAFLYGLVGTALVLVSLGYTLWWTRRPARQRWTAAVRPARRIHARVAPFAGFLLATQMLVGAFLWFNLGLIEPRFRGQGSFRDDWSGGISVTEHLADARSIADALPAELLASERPIQRYEWRAVGDERFWLAYPARNENGVLVDAHSGAVLDRLTPEQAAVAGRMVVAGEPAGPSAESMEYWMDFNARVPTYRFRFADPDDSDVHISQITGEVVQRRPAIWRAFGPFLSYHTFGFTGNPWFDTILLTALQLTILTMVVTGWMMVLRSKRAASIGGAAGTPDDAEIWRST